MELSQNLIIYPQCDKNGYHSGEVMNTVCLDEKCRINSLLCSACVHQGHKSHSLMSLKLFLHQNISNFQKIKNNLSGNVSLQNEKQQLLNYLENLKQETISDYQNIIDQLMTQSKKIQNCYEEYFEKIQVQIEKQCNFYSDFNDISENIYNKNIEIDDLQKKVIQVLQYKNQLDQETSQLAKINIDDTQQNPQKNNNFTIDQQQQQSVDQNNGNKGELDQQKQKKDHNQKEINMDLQQQYQQQQKNQEQMTDQSIQQIIITQIQNAIKQKQCDFKKIQDDKLQILKEQMNKVEKETREYIEKVGNQNLLDQSASSYQFQSLLHPAIKKTDNYIVKSTSTSGYKIALLEPSLSSNCKQTFAFKVKNIGTSNWIGIGICQKDIAIQKQFVFASGQLGHGAYMISSNAGSWSSCDKSFNQCVKAFQFKAGDTIICDFDPQNGKINFKHQKTLAQYNLIVEKSVENKFCPALILYSMNDEVEFLNEIP